MVGRAGAGARAIVYAAALAVSNLVLPWGAAADTPPAYQGSWGSYGNGNGQFYQPLGLASDASGTIYVGDGRVQAFSGVGDFLSSFSLGGLFARALSVAPNGDILVLCYETREVKEFTPNGTLVRSWWNGRFYDSFGIAVDASGFVYVPYYGGDGYIMKFSSAGQLLATWPDSVGALGMCVDSQGHIWVTHVGGLIYEFNSDGVRLAQWGSYGSGPGQFVDPRGIAVDPNGVVYVADTWNHRVQKLTSTGVPLAVWGTRGTGPGQFDRPYGITLDALGNVYVDDSGNNRIQKFGPGPVPAAETTWGRVKALYR